MNRVNIWTIIIGIYMQYQLYIFILQNEINERNRYLQSLTNNLAIFIQFINESHENTSKKNINHVKNIKNSHEIEDAIIVENTVIKKKKGHLLIYNVYHKKSISINIKNLPYIKNIYLKYNEKADTKILLKKEKIHFYIYVENKKTNQHTTFLFYEVIYIISILSIVAKKRNKTIRE